MPVRVRFSCEVPRSIGGLLDDEELAVQQFGYPSIPELRRARLRGFLTPLKVIEVETEKWNEGLSLQADETDIALLLSDEADRVDEILEVQIDEFSAYLPRILPGWDEDDRYWLDFFLSRVAVNAPANNVPDAANFILDEFSYPDDLNYLSHRTDPTTPSSLSGRPLRDELALYIDQRIAHYRARRLRRV